MKKTIFIAAALVTMIACNKNVIEMPSTEVQYGYINLGVTADTEMVVTKGITTVANLDGYTITLKNVDKNEPEWTKKFTEFTGSEWKVPAGQYTIAVYDKADISDADAVADVYTLNEGKGDKYIYGVGTVNVVAGESNDCDVECKVQNSKVSFASTDKFRDVFTSASVVVAEKKENPRSKTATVGESHLDGNTIYFEPVALTWTLDATTELDGKTRRYTGEVTLVQSKWTEVTFTTGNTDGQIDVTISVNDRMETVTLEPVTVDPFTGEVVSPEV